MISIRNVDTSQAKEDNAIKAMNLLQGNEESSLVIKEDESTPSFETTLFTENYEQENSINKDSANDHNDLIELFSQVGNLKTIKQKRKFMREIAPKHLKNLGENSLEPGSHFDIEKTYNPIAIEITNELNSECDEEKVQSLVVGRYMMDRYVEEHFVKTGIQKVYKGNPELWTPLDKVIPEEEHKKIKDALRDYVEPNYFENKYQTRRRREAMIKPLEPETDYIKLPRMTQYVDEGKKLIF